MFPGPLAPSTLELPAERVCQSKSGRQGQTGPSRTPTGASPPKTCSKTWSRECRLSFSRRGALEAHLLHRMVQVLEDQWSPEERGSMHVPCSRPGWPSSLAPVSLWPSYGCSSDLGHEGSRLGHPVGALPARALLEAQSGAPVADDQDWAFLLDPETRQNNSGLRAGYTIQRWRRGGFGMPHQRLLCDPCSWCGEMAVPTLPCPWV